MSKNKGFTLLEIMVVLAIIGVAAGMISANLGNGSKLTVRQEALRFAAVVNHVIDESILLGTPLGIQVDDGDASYRFYEFDQGWKQTSDDDYLKDYQLPEDIQLEFDLEETIKKDRRGEQSSSFTPKAVAAMFDESILAKAENRFKTLGKEDDKREDKVDNLIVSEPTGLLPNFTLRFSSEGNSVTVVLDEYGKARLDED